MSFGVIERAFGLKKVKEVLKKSGRASQRERAQPAHIMVYYTIALALYMGSSYREVLRWMSSHLRGPRVVLRSKTPELVRQEFYGFLMAHFAVRGLMHEAALKEDVDPDKLSFIHSVRVIRRKLPHFAAIPP